ncbi:hypothetical protein [Terribacillus sp. JSM ZJ617]|uniref:hypothetical protein n=1 Tax=Terribacillus sp. JSM ZJ617 TaxID=3342119 RepID=UPI0035A8AA40
MILLDEIVQSSNDTYFQNFEYDKQTLKFLRDKHNEFTTEVFRKILIYNRENQNLKGLVKTRLEDYKSKRKKYDAAFIVLESQGFIEKKEDGTSTPYFVTIRGLQLGTLLTQEKKRRDIE